MPTPTTDIPDDALAALPTPCYLVDEALLQKNMDILDSVQQRTGCRIILALKGFSFFPTFPMIGAYLYGTAASSLNEARLGRDEFGGEVHVCSPAYADHNFDKILGLADHLVFNSFSQWKRFRPRVRASGRPIKCGIRINPQHSEVKKEIYDPCRKHSRLGVTATEFEPDEMEGISGLHFHSLCELGFDALKRTLAVVEKAFGLHIEQMEWINFGGGHHITRDYYDTDALCNLINTFRKRYNVDVYLEPGEAIALNAGVLVASVVDIVKNQGEIAILDASASAHMPDVLEMPYRPEVAGAGLPDEFPHRYTLAGNTCLAGDIMGDYSLPQPLSVGDRVVFLDMAHYTMVKNTTFNGVPLPSLAVRDAETRECRIVRRFSYDDYKSRLG